MTCLLCLREADSQKTRMCFECWELFGSPSSPDDLVEFMKTHPSAETALRFAVDRSGWRKAPVEPND